MLAIDNEFQPTTSSDSTLPISEGVVLGFCVLRAVEQHVWAGGQCAGKVRCHAPKHKQPTTPPKQNTPQPPCTIFIHFSRLIFRCSPISVRSPFLQQSVVTALSELPAQQQPGRSMKAALVFLIVSTATAFVPAPIAQSRSLARPSTNLFLAKKSKTLIALAVVR